MIERFRKFLRKRGIKSRMFFAFIVLPLGVMVLMFLLYYFSSMNLIISKNKQNSQTTIELTEENIYLNTTKMEEQFTSIAQGYLVANVFLEQDVATHQQDVSTFMKESLYLQGRKNLQLYDTSGTLLYDENDQFHINFQTIIKEFRASNKPMQWIFDAENDEVVLIHSVNVDHKLVGYVVCGFYEKAFSPSFSKVDSNDTMLVIVDKKHRYLFGSSILDAYTKIDTRNDEVSLKNSSYYIESKKIKNMDWEIVNLISSEYLLEEFHNFRNMILIYGIVIVIVLEIIATFVYRSIYDPLHNLLNTMHRVDENNVIKMRVIDDGNDEIHEVVDNFNELLDRVEDLLKTVEMEQEQKRETQILLLQAQINPHFLFNTLNTLHFLAMMNEDKPVSEGIRALAKLLRNTIVDSKEVVSVNEEIENLKNYIVIQKLRYGDLFETVYNVDDEVKNCQILKFLLQPIVENSILHAFDEDKEHQLITIRVQRYGKYLKIEIGDNGKGFVLDQIETTKTTLSGIGMNNIKERIQLMYGETYSMNIKSVPNTGTIVTLLLPYVKGDVYV